MNFILEGPALDQRNAAGKPIMSGWRHYRIVMNGRGVNCLAASSEMTNASVARLFGAKFYPSGSWEDTSREASAGFMPFPRADIAKEIYL